MSRPLALTLAICACLPACKSIDHRDDAQSCKSLVGAGFQSGTVERAELVNEGDSFIGFFKRMFLKIAAPGFPNMDATADFCRVTAKLRPVPGSEITTEIWLPRQWNGKLVGMGGGGFNGGLSGTPLGLNSPLRKGYAGFATDAGHEDVESLEFAYESKEKLIDYAYRANQVATSFAKALLLDYYGKPVGRAYFTGCSNGGRDGLMLAHRSPGEYDGIIAGSPASGYSRLAVSFAWIQATALTAPGLEDKLQLVNDAVIEKCDALDGVKDGILENPMRCQFDPAELQCESRDKSSCLTTNEVIALQKIYAGPSLSDGTRIYPGLSVGGEAIPGNWDEWVVGNTPIAAELFRWTVYDDPTWDISRFDIDKDYPNARDRIGPILDADGPDLSEFFESGGKLIVYHGWNDAGVPSQASVEFVEAIHETVGPIAQDHVRLYMVPGMMHCAGGVGATGFDMLPYLENWVENNEVPDMVIAAETDPPSYFGINPDAELIGTHPLCPWPQLARYNGAGSTHDAASFSCQQDQEMGPVK